MKKYIRHISIKFRYEQKKEWDKIAYSFFNKYGHILDVGCGEGRFNAQKHSRIIGIDFNKKSLTTCKKKGLKVIMSDTMKLPFKDNSVPGIHCSHVIEHFLPTHVHKILSEFNRVLMPEGILIIRSPLLWNRFYDDLTHIRPYNPYAIIKYLTPTKQRTLEQITVDFEVLKLKWRFKPLKTKNNFINNLLDIFNRWGFPWFKKNGYLLVMKKRKR